MGTRNIQFAPGEWFHCFSRGVDKRIIFTDDRDAQRFQMLLYTSNGDTPIHISNLSNERQGPALPNVLRHERGNPLVDISAYCLMPNHFHLLLREIDYGGISAFMQKLGTGYTMYFNKKYERTGALFSGRFKAVHIAADAHSRRIIHYIHANPAELYEPGWKKGIIKSATRLKKKLLEYPFSSLRDYDGFDRPERAILSMAGATELLDTAPSFKTLIQDARTFYRIEKNMLDDIEP